MIHSRILSVSDNNNDSKIHIEEHNNEDKIRFITEGQQRMIISNSTTSGNIGIGLNFNNPTSTLDIQGDLAVSNKIGIGTNNPQYKLDVDGHFNITGNIYQNGSLLEFVGGVKELDTYVLESNIVNNISPINNWKRHTKNFTKLGNGVSEQNGIFSFPTVGTWEINCNILWQTRGAHSPQVVIYENWSDYPNWNVLKHLTDGGTGPDSGHGAHTNSSSSATIPITITDINTQKIKFVASGLEVDQYTLIYGTDASTNITFKLISTPISYNPTDSLITIYNNNVGIDNNSPTTLLTLGKHDGQNGTKDLIRFITKRHADDNNKGFVFRNNDDDNNANLDIIYDYTAGTNNIMTLNNSGTISLSELQPMSQTNFQLHSSSGDGEQQCLIGNVSSKRFRKIILEAKNNATSSDAQIYFILNGVWKNFNGISSDTRYKINQEEYPTISSLNIVKNIKIKSYFNTLSKKNDIGFIAQDVYKILPDVVDIQDLSVNGLLSDFHFLNYTSLCIHSFGAIQQIDKKQQEQDLKIKNLEEENKYLRNELNLIKQHLNLT